LIGGFVVEGTGTKRLVLRVLAPSLASQGLQGVMSDPMLEVYDSSRRLLGSNDNWRLGASASELQSLGLAPADDREAALVLDVAPGAVTVLVRGVAGAQGVAIVEAYEVAGEGVMTARIVNVSIRGKVQTGENVLIGGIAVRGNGPRRLLIRALGPSLASFMLGAPLADPTLSIYDSTGTLVATNNDWKSAQQTEIAATGLAPSSDAEAALIATLPPGNYTAIIAGQGGTVGIALLEVYDVTSP
ncbi:MAG: hypothetical protein JSR82_09570, partial [Verrucomicrobia bacterium]|nr:hypothetical protein [Verrucomicrobiota bacterium]